MHIDLVGIGMEGCATLTKEAADAIQKAELLIGAARMLETVPADGRERFIAYDAEKIASHLENSKARRAAVLLSGDVGFFSGAKQLISALRGHDVQCIPGISSLLYLCAKAAISWENIHVVSLHGTDSSVAVHVMLHERTFFLLGGYVTASDVCETLYQFGLGNTQVVTGSRLGYPDEQIICDIAANLRSVRTDHLAVMIVENPAFLRHLPVCIPDRDFIRKCIPMTKAEVRGITVSSLNIAKNDTCWDIGCGTGSVSVEMAFRCPDGIVHAIDQNADAISLSLENAKKFGCDNIRFLHGEAPLSLHDLPAPDCVFIGGSSGQMESIFDEISKKNPFARIAVNAVTLETLYAAQSAFRTRGGSCEITQIAVNPMKEIGDFTMFQAQNPVFLIRGVLR